MPMIEHPEAFRGEVVNLLADVGRLPSRLEQ